MINNSANIESFKRKLLKLMIKHEVYLFGNIKIRTSENTDIDFTTYKCELADSVSYGGITDKTGQFLISTASEKPRAASQHQSIKITLMDKDKLLANGVPSPITGKAYSNRREWNDHLKANGCVEVGNDLNNVKETAGKLRGDFDVRNDLGKATYEVMDKYGY